MFVLAHEEQTVKITDIVCISINVTTKYISHYLINYIYIYIHTYTHTHIHTHTQYVRKVAVHLGYGRIQLNCDGTMAHGDARVQACVDASGHHFQHLL